MFFERIFSDDLAQASYLIGCQRTGEAVVVDPRREPEAYLARARAQGLTITTVTETHIHADYLSGSRELAARAGAALYLSAEGGADWRYRFGHRGLEHGDTLSVGNVRLEARHTPGHTPEHLSFLLTDGATTDMPGFYLTGDFVFVGDVGRPDLLDESGIGADTREPMAHRLFASLRDEFLTLPDFIQVWPGHGAGSACGKALGAVSSSTVGYEKLVAWWVRYIQNGDVDGFVRALLEGQPEAPSYFARMKRQNRAGPPLQSANDELEELQGTELDEHLLLIDTRPRSVYAQDAVPGSLHLPLSKSLATHASYGLDPEREPRGLVLLAQSRAEALEVRRRLRQVGIDHVVGFIRSSTRLGGRPLPVVQPEDLGTITNPYLLDVRSKSEYDAGHAGHLPGAAQMHAGQVLQRLETLPRDSTIVSYCQSGARNTVIASALRLAGFEVVELAGSFEAWQEAGQPVARTGNEKVAPR